jgi:glycosyltransferase involved in cell wall biosynthesis
MGTHVASRLVTPVVLTYNEAPNIARALRSLSWADEVVIVDSGSTDETERIAREFINVRWLVRPFDNHAAQWDFAIQAACGRAPYVLALDADYQVPPAFAQEIGEHFTTNEYTGGIAGFEYQIQGRALFASVYPAKLVLFRPDAVKVTQPGHSQELVVEGRTYRFATRLVHDDRKSLARFVASQMEYSRLEAQRLATGNGHRWQDRVRRRGLMPAVAGLAAYLRAGGPLRGTAALRYAYERTLFECLLALRVLSPENETEKGRTGDNSPPPCPKQAR